MDINDRKARYSRAMTLFEAEAREQQLAAVALRKATQQHRAEPQAGAPQGEVSARLHDIDQTVRANILNAHRELEAARREAARMAATDAQLAQLHAFIDGVDTGSVAPDVYIEGEAARIDTPGGLLPPVIRD